MPIDEAGTDGISLLSAAGRGWEDRGRASKACHAASRDGVRKVLLDAAAGGQELESQAGAPGLLCDEAQYAAKAQAEVASEKPRSAHRSRNVQSMLVGGLYERRVMGRAKVSHLQCR